MSENLGTTTEIGTVHYKLFRWIQVTDFLIRDSYDDTLIYVRTADARINFHLTSPWGKSYVLDKVTGDGGLMRLINLPGREPNFADFFNALNRDTSKKFWPYFGIRDLQLTNTRFILQTERTEKNNKVHFRNLRLSGISVNVRNLEIFKRQTRMRIRNLMFRDQSGWTVNDMGLNFEITPEHLYLNRVNIAMPYSNIHANRFSLNYEQFDDFRDFINKVNIDLELRQSAIGFRDLAWFLTDPSTIRNNVFISGNVRGTISDMQVDRLRIQSGLESEFNGDIEAIGLPDIENTYLYINVRDMKSSVRDLQSFYRPGTHKHIKLPDNFLAFGNLDYQGNFTGFINDFVSYGSLNTDIGNFTGDISFKTDSADQIAFQGQLNTYQVNVGTLLGKDSLAQHLTMNMHVDGHTFPGNRFRTKLKGIVDSVEINRYMFHRANLDGTFTEKAYDGLVRIDDPNLRMDFAGLVDFTRKVPEFDFTLNVPRANLFPLHLEKEDSAATFSCLVLANFTGASIDSLNGRINLLDAHMQHEGRKLEVYDVALKARSDSTGKSLTLGSTYAEGSLEGQYDFATFIPSLKQILSDYFPQTFSAQPSAVLEKNNFTFTLKLTHPEPFQFFFPGMNFSDQISFRGRYSPADHMAEMMIKAPGLTYKGIRSDSLSMMASAGDSILNISVDGNKFEYKKLIRLQNFHTDIGCQNDTADSWFQYISGDSVSNRTTLHLLTAFKPTENKPFTSFTVDIDSALAWINHSWWKLHRSKITRERESLGIENFILAHDSHLFSLDGALSNHRGDTLSANFRDLNLASLSHRNRNGKLSLDGILQGSVKLTRNAGQTLFFSETDIEDFSLNNEPLGMARILSRWDTSMNALAFNIDSRLSGRKPFAANGTYLPATRKIRADLITDSLNLKIFSPFTDVVFKDMTGTVSGNLHAEGPLSQPLLSGNLSINNTAFTIAYINTRYHFSAEVPISKSRFDLSGIKIFDPYGNSGYSKGYISVENFRKPQIDLHLEAENMLALNIRQNENDIFYGRAFGSGIISISGPFSDITLDISATTMKSSELFLPLGKAKSISSFDFIEFTGDENTASREQIRRIASAENEGINMNLDLKITPDAEVSLIFDPATGEVLRSRGHGDLQLVLKKTSGFSMYGEYTEDEGDYLFTLQNIINKRFRLENGGKIVFNGDPLNAELNIKAVYPVKTSLYQLLYDENYKRRIPVECQIMLTGKLQQPNIAFDINLPTADEDTRTRVQNAITSQEELNKQFLSLLIINSFYPDPSYGQPGLLTTAGTIGSTTTEVLSNQLSNWLSQISNDFDIGFSYHPGDEVTSSQVEVALSTQLLNDRVSINGNVDFKGQQQSTSTNNIVGDFQIEVKLTDNGKLRVKAFTRANDKFIYETAPYTNGIGIFYREEFDSWDQLMANYWNRIISGKKNEKK